MEIERTDAYILVRGDFTVLSSAVFNGGLKEHVRAIVNANVGEDFNEDPVEFFRKFLAQIGVKEDEVVGMMTAVPMENASIVTKGDVSAIVTAGLSPSTVNTILVIERDLSVSALAEAIIVATEAKSRAFYELNVRSPAGEIMTGDLTDAIAVACCPRRPHGSEEQKEQFAGKATPLGASIYDAVRSAVKESLRSSGWRAEKSILERLRERGVQIADIANAAFELFVGAPADAKATSELRERFEREVERACSDLNVSALIYAAMLLDDAVEKGWFGGEFASSDASCIVADELIGIDIAEYIGGKNALFNFFRYDTKKPGILSRLPVFLDDAVGGLIAGCMSKMFACIEERTTMRKSKEKD
ncbi:MAG: phosphatidylglycerophosphatase A [Candidatus Methanospirare jalkutatii]|nr:MAG: phosphatidylglycerophosphatase A [Candidatus Methanospirare jalkutatii]